MSRSSARLWVAGAMFVLIPALLHAAAAATLAGRVPLKDALDDVRATAEIIPGLTVPAKAAASADAAPIASPRSVSLVLLPRGTDRVTLSGIEIPGESSPRPVPAAAAAVTSIMRLRGIPIGVLELDRAAITAACGADGSGATLALSMEGAALGAPAKARPAADAREDPLAETPRLLTSADLMGLLAAAPNPDGSAPAGQGCYLIISAPEFAPPLADLVAWKRQAGYEVHLYTTDDTGPTREEIHAFIKNAYDTWENPPLYILLVGDIDRMPTWYVQGPISDHPYSLLDGDDFLADAYVGRFSANYPGEIAVQVAKTVRYESAPDTTGGDNWFSRAVLVAGNYASSTPVPLNRWFGEELRAIGYAQTDSVFYSNAPQHPWWNGRVPIRTAINRGVGVVNYRGWAYGDVGWEPPHFLAEDVQSLSNGWKLPVVFSIVCHTGNFGSPVEDCMGEAWLKSGTVDEPKGAVAFVGTPEDWSHTRWNDRMDMGIAEAFCHAGLRRFGAIVNATKLSLITEFPTELHFADALDDAGQECAEFYNNTYNILGDPSLEVWTDVPRALAINDLPATLAPGQNCLTFSVVAADGGARVGGARIALTQGDELVGYAVSAADAPTTVSLALRSSDPVTVMVTGENLYPMTLERAVAPEALALTCVGATAVGGVQLTAGQTVDLQLTAQNTGTGAIGSATATVAGSAKATVLAGATGFGAIAAGATGTSTTAVRVKLDPFTANGERLRLVMTPTIGGQARTPSEAWLTAVAPELACRAAGDGVDGRFDPGEQANLVFTLGNAGAASGTLDARLRLVVPGSATIVDSTASFASIAAGAEGTNAASPFVISIPAQTAVGTVIPLTLQLTSSAGPQARVHYNLIVGAIDFAAPSGPDAYGYYAYDSADIDYPGQAPAYDWIECSTLYGGTGQRLSQIGDNRGSTVVTLPFTFQYYGVPYNALRVSDNGWAAFDLTNWIDIRNWNMPGKWGSACQIAPFWDNLDPEYAGSDDIYVWDDAEHHRFVVEWSRLRNWEPTTDDFQTFEVVFYDPAHYPTATGDGELVFQYKQVVNDDYTRMYSTVGIEDQTEEIGLTYTYGNQYAPGAAPLTSGLAIKFTTAAPVYEPLSLTRFTAAWRPSRGPLPAGAPDAADAADAGGAQVDLAWELPATPAIVGLALTRAVEVEPGRFGAYLPAHEGLLGPGCTAFCDAAAGLDPDRAYAYRLAATDRFGKTRLLGETLVTPGVVRAAFVRCPHGAIATGAVDIEFASPLAELREFAIYDAAGRRVIDLRPPAPTLLAQTISWDGRDAAGRRVPAGLYWIRLRAGDEARVARVLIVR
jgi:hypothetical protein